jgi:ABC-type antimicrobial peptide transport system permease subunit
MGNHKERVERLERLSFYLRNAVNSLLRERRRAIFAVFTVAVGVAAIVGLQLTADVLESTLTTNVRTLLRGDLTVTRTSEQGSSFERTELTAVEQLEEEGLIDGFTTAGSPSDFADFFKFTLSVAGRTDNDAIFDFWSPLFLEKDVYPYYGEVRSGGKGLWELIEDDFDVVVTRNLANRHDINVNDQLKLGDVATLFTVKGILTGSALGRTGDPLAGNVIFRWDTIESVFPDLKDPVSEIYILAPGRSDGELALIDERLEAISPLVESTTPAELEEDNQESADTLRSVILVFGLVALAIGGIGIANTMQVLVSRRLPEAGVLKAIGLKGRQVMAVFLTEALIIGTLGSLIGIVSGILVSFVTLRVVEGVVPLDLKLHVGAGPIITGLIVGILVTLAFGLLPTVGAGRVRPLAAIRPNDSDLVKGSWLTSTLLLLALAVVMGIVVGVLIGTMVIGLIGTLVAFVVVGILLLMLVGVVYLLSRLPSFQTLTLHLSFLEWRRRKLRAASLLLAMSIGVLGIGLILMLADTLISGLRTSAEDAIGGDVIMVINDPAEKEEAFARIRDADGVALLSPGTVYETRLVAINGVTEALEDRIAAAELDAEDRQELEDYFGVVAVRAIDEALPRLEFSAEGGRMLDESDVGRNTVALQHDSAIEVLDLEVGDQLSFQGLDRDGADSGSRVQFEIVGIAEEDPFGITLFGSVLTASDPLQAQDVPPLANMAIVEVDDDNRDDLVRDLNLELDSVFVVETETFTDLFADLLRQFRTFPLVLAGLSLLAAVVIIANAVALSTIERRREIGLLKAVGAKARWVVVQLALENTLLGFVGGLIGLAIALAALLAITMLLDIALVISPVIIIGVLVLSTVLSLVVTLLSAYPAAQERPLDILRGD